MVPSPFTVLLVEDEPGDRRLVEEALRDAPVSFRLEPVTSLAAAVAWLREHTPAAVLLDLNLPDSSGIDTLLVFRAHFPRLPVVVLTGRSIQEGPRALRSGANAYLVKDDLNGEALGLALLSAVARQETVHDVGLR